MNRIMQQGWQRRSCIRIGATFAAAAIALIAGGKPSEAMAADGTTDVTVQIAEGDENLAWSVPTQIPMKATASGTLIAPDADVIAIRNLSAFPIRVKQMDTTAEAPFHLVDDVNKSSGNNDFQMSMNDTAVKQTVELPDDGTWAMGYAGNEDGNDVLPIAISNAKIARVTADLSATKKAATVTWTVEPTAKDSNQPGTTEPGGSDSVQEAVAKDAKDWTLGEQKAVAEDIAAKGEASSAYAKAKAAMDAGTIWRVRLTNGKEMKYRIIGINHDSYADGSGRAGLTFQTMNSAFGTGAMNAAPTNVGGWEKSELRQKMNSGEIWNLLPSEFQTMVKSVSKLTNNAGGLGGVPSSTDDKLFLLSSTEIWGDVDADGSQYELYAGLGVDSSNYSALASRYNWCTRSIDAMSSKSFKRVLEDGSCYVDGANYTYALRPAFCF